MNKADQEKDPFLEFTQQAIAKYREKSTYSLQSNHTLVSS